MQEIKCPKCGEVFQVDESGYAAIVKQIRDREFQKEVYEREQQFKAHLQTLEKDRQLAIKNAVGEKDAEIAQLKAQLNANAQNNKLSVSEAVAVKEKEITALEARLAAYEMEKRLAVSEVVFKTERQLAAKNEELIKLTNQIESNEKESKIREQSIKDGYEAKLKIKDEQIDYYKDQNPDNIMLELVGMSAGKSREMTLNTYPHLYTTAYAEYDETPKKFLEKGYQDGKFYVGVGCHDNDSLVNLARDTYKRDLHTQGMKRDYGLDTSKLGFNSEEYKKQDYEAKIQEDFRTAKFGEIFTSAKQFFTLPDMFGMEERINISGKASKNNWTIRIPTDYEKFYFSQLANGFGLNLPKALSTAMGMKHSTNQELIKKCNEAAEILRQKGPMTEKEANAADQQGKLDKKFEYVS